MPGVPSRKVEQVLDQEVGRYVERTPASRALYDRAVQTFPFGVASSFHALKPHPLYLRSGKGSTVTDIDGNTYIDYHSAFGSMVVGHAHPAVTEAIRRVAGNGVHFAATTETAVSVGEEIKRRFGLERVRFVNSGTEATMDAVRLARAASGKPAILKVEGSYHGHHDAVMYAVDTWLDDRGDRPYHEPFSRGIPDGLARYTKVVPFNDVPALAAMLERHGDEIGAMILEPVLMNVGVIVPAPGYLAAIRELCTRHGVILIFDEVKTGVTIAPGGATEHFGVRPDLVCLAKSIGGGVPIGAYGGRADIMDEITKGVAAVGTFNGNPLSMAAAHATLTEVLDDAAYERLRALGTRLAGGCQKVLDQYGIPAVTMDLGAKGCITFRDRPLERYSDFQEVDASIVKAYWNWGVNRGVYQAPGRAEQWTISVQHTEDDIDRTLNVFGEYFAAVAG